MTVLDWVAIIGALAWLPHLLSILTKYISKPVVRMIPPKGVDIGFTSFGPIFNLHLAFSVKNKDIVLSNLKVQLQHEGGDTHEFHCEGIDQTLMTMKVPDGPALPYEKKHSIFAFKINVKDIEEKIIKFQSPSFRSSSNDLISAAAKQQSFLKNKDQYDPEAFLKSEAMHNIITHNQNSFLWRSGSYTVTITADSPERYTLLDNTYKFSLNEVDIIELERNKPLIEKDLYNILVPQPPEQFEEVTWQWRHPQLFKS